MPQLTQPPERRKHVLEAPHAQPLKPGQCTGSLQALLPTQFLEHPIGLCRQLEHVFTTFCYSIVLADALQKRLCTELR